MKQASSRIPIAAVAVVLAGCLPSSESSNSSGPRSDLQAVLEDVEAAFSLRNDAAAEALFTSQVETGDASVSRETLVSDAFGYFNAFGQDTDVRIFDFHAGDGDVMEAVVTADMDDAPRYVVRFGFEREGSSWVVSSMEGVDLAPLRLHNLGLDLSESKRDTLFPLEGDFQMYAYGRETNPNFEYIVNIEQDVDVLSPIAGVVVKVGTNSDNEDPGSRFDDYHVQLRPSEDSPWQIELDHVIDPTVEAGDVVQAGDAVGKPSDDWGGDADHIGRVEMQVNDDSFYWCPILPAFWDTDDLDVLENRLRNMMERWNADDGNEPGYYEIEDVLACNHDHRLMPEDFAE